MILLPCLNCFWNLWALHSANLEILWLAVAHLISKLCNFTVTEIHLHALGLKLMFFSHSATSCLSSPLYAFGLDAYLYRDNWKCLPSPACLLHLWRQFVPDQCLLSSFDKANSEVTPSPKVPEEPASSSSYECLAMWITLKKSEGSFQVIQWIWWIRRWLSMEAGPGRSMLCLSEQEFADVWLQLSST